MKGDCFATAPSLMRTSGYKMAFDSGSIPPIAQVALTLPVERALFYRVNESDHQNDHEPKHAAENGPRIEIINIVAVHDGPRVHEHDLDIEQNKQHRDQVEFNTESRLGFTLGRSCRIRRPNP